jgi:hypothetical protein
VGLTPDRHPGPLDEEGVYLEPSSVVPATNGEFRYVVGTGFRFFEEGTLKGLTGTGISEAQHRVLRQLIHFIDDGPAEGFLSGAYKETTPASPFPTLEVWWESSSKLKKIVELATTWTGVNIPQEQWKVYDVDGSTVLATVTDSISYSGVFETSRTRTITVP